MEAIILAGGLGTRLRNLVPAVPKPMAPIAGRPFLEILLDSLSQKGFKRIILSLGFKAESISEYFGSKYAGMEIIYVVEQVQLGTGGGARLAMERVESSHVYVFNGDTFLDVEVEDIEMQWNAAKRSLIVAREVMDTSRYGQLLVSNGVVTGFSNDSIKGPGLINAGCYIFCPEQLNKYPLNKKFSLEIDFLMPSIAQKKFDVFLTRGLFIDIGVPDDYLRAQKLLAKATITR